MRIGAGTFAWGARTYVMGIVNVTPDSFSGDGLLDGGDDSVVGVPSPRPPDGAEGADMLDVGGESTRPGHADVDADEELRRAVPVVRAIRAALPDMPISIDTTKRAGGRRGRSMPARIWSTTSGASAARRRSRCASPQSAACRSSLMHNRAEARYRTSSPRSSPICQRALDARARRRRRLGSLIVDPGIGFGKTAEQNLAVLRDLHADQRAGRPVLLGTSRKSTIGKVLDLPADERLEGTLATTALGVGRRRRYRPRPRCRSPTCAPRAWPTRSCAAAGDEETNT